MKTLIILPEAAGVRECAFVRRGNLVNRIILLSAVALAFVFAAGAQTVGKSDAKPVPFSDGVAAPSRPMPFTDGEVLAYEGKISKIIKGIAIADLIFTVSRQGPNGDYKVKADANSKGTLLKMFRYSFSQQIDSTIDGTELRSKKTVKRDVQRDRIRESEAVFNYKERSVTYTEIDPKEPMRPPRKIASEIGPDTLDMVAGLYTLRTLPLAVGKVFEMEISDSGLFYKIPVRVTAREQQKTVVGNVWCFRVEPNVFGEGMPIEKEGSMIIWITDDARRLPVRSQVNSPIGRVEIKLKSAKNLKT